jgi:hypothetical protein
MQINYKLNGQTREFEVNDSDDLAVMGPEIEERLRNEHPQFANQPFLTEKVVEALLISFADNGEAVDLGDLSTWNGLCLPRNGFSTFTSSPSS